MSNFLAVATVTATLSHVIDNALNQAQADERGAVPGFEVKTSRPEDLGTPAKPTVNIFLARITPNPALRNLDLPTTGANGEMIRKPTAALNLHYLLSFYGDDGKLEPHRLFGVVVRYLHSQPVLTRKMIQDTIADPKYNYLSSADLADSIESVKFSPVTLSVEELSKLWSVFFQTPYTLTVAYDASVILVEARTAVVTPLPVLERGVYVKPLNVPIIDRITSATGPDQPIQADSTIAVFGQHLQASKTRLRVFGVDLDPNEVTDTRILQALNVQPLANVVRAGPVAVQVSQPTMMGTPIVEHTGTESNVSFFTLDPKIVNVAVNNVGGKNVLTIVIMPVLRASQNATILLNPLESGRGQYSISVRPPQADTNTIAVDIAGTKSGDYLVRVQIEGAQSPLVRDANLAYVGPKVTLP